jgi:hypothetical protein
VFPKIKSALKGLRFQDIEDIHPTKCDGTERLFHSTSSRNVSNSDSIVGLSAQLLKGSNLKVTPLNKLKYTSIQIFLHIIILGIS